jgi:hypothetical protein
MARNALARALSSSGLVSGDCRRMKMAVAAASAREGVFSDQIQELHLEIEVATPGTSIWG